MSRDTLFVQKQFRNSLAVLIRRVVSTATLPFESCNAVMHSTRDASAQMFANIECFGVTTVPVLHLFQKQLQSIQVYTFLSIPKQYP
jgi:hypothetical protein